MKVLIMVSIVLICSIVSFSQVLKIKRLDGSRIATHEVDRLVSELMTKAKVTGLALAILNDNRIVYTNALGYKNKQKLELLDRSTVLYGASLFGVKIHNFNRRSSGRFVTAGRPFYLGSRRDRFEAVSC